MAVLALIVADTECDAFGRSNALDRVLGDRPVLQHTVERAAGVSEVERIVLIHPAHQDPSAMINTSALRTPVSTYPVEGHLADRYTPHLRAARKWAMTSWRGGLGEATVYDELLPPAPLHDAAASFNGEAVMIVRGEWCLFDPSLTSQQLQTHLDQPEGLSITFAQTPPGLSPIVCARSVLDQLKTNEANFGPIFGYNPKKPRPDPIARDANVQIPASVRDCHHRFIADNARSLAMLDALAASLGQNLPQADAASITDAVYAIEAEQTITPFDRLPQQITLELTPRRDTAGEVTPQHYVTLDRPDLPLDRARQVVEDIAMGDDPALLLGGLGDALLHPEWDQLVLAAHQAGVLGIGIETDLRCDKETVDRVLELPLDLVVVRLNADQPDTYATTMGADDLPSVADNIRHLLERRRARADTGEGEIAQPWLVPTLTKTETSLSDMESFFQRWTATFGCQPVLTPATTGCGKMPDLSPVPMTPPKRKPCRQLGRRMSILSDGTVALCDQDWLGEAALGQAGSDDLLTLWQNAHAPWRAHQNERYDELELCRHCSDWHRP